MASRTIRMKSMLPDLASALQSFSTSSSRFRIVQTINAQNVQPKSLYILDSSFNPPSHAHRSMVLSALRRHEWSGTGPCGLLLLFSMHNADKAPKPAEFSQRVAMMIAFAEDVLQQLERTRQSRDDAAGCCYHYNDNNNTDISIDIGLTKEPYFCDKSAAIVAANESLSSSSSSSSCLSRSTHIHLVGFDTFVRICDSKYYPTHNPPLSALKPYFQAGHKILVAQRPDGSSASSNDEESLPGGFGTAQEQQRYFEELCSGAQAEQGFEPAWTDAISIMTKMDESVGISSTRIRKAAQEGDWITVYRSCPEGVADWIRDQQLYRAVKTKIETS